MTSSLVGSEMCIRDSASDKLHLQPDIPARVHAISYAAQGTWLWMQLAVSYTHLTLPTICSV
eukprot:2586469-Prorocentrum_lima.AAC.1